MVIHLRLSLDNYHSAARLVVLLEEIPSQVIPPSKRGYTFKSKSRLAHLNEPILDASDQPQDPEKSKTDLEEPKADLLQSDMLIEPEKINPLKRTYVWPKLSQL